MADSSTDELIKIGDGLFSKAAPWNMMAQDICENFYPARADYTAWADISTDYASYIMDGSPIVGLETLANTIPAMLRQGEWFQVGSGDEDRDKQPDVARALNWATQRMRGVINDKRSNWRPATIEADHDWCSVGQSVLSLQENPERTNFQFHAHHPRDCAWLVDGTGQTVTMFRKLRMSARNILRRIDQGSWNGTVKQDVRDAAKMDPGREFNLYHVLMQTDELFAADHRAQVEVGHPYVSLYIDCEHRTMLHKGGVPVFNYITPGFRRLSGHSRGYSPVTFNAIGDARMLQSLALIILEQGEKAVDPPMVASGEVFNGSDINLYSGGTTFVDLGERNLKDVMTTVQTAEGLRLGVDLKQDVRALIAESLLLNKLTLPSVREMRELEVAVRTEEFRRAALPFFTPIEAEYHEKILALTFDMMSVRGMFPEGLFPAALRETDVHFTFQSPLNEAEGRKTVESYLTGLSLLEAAAPLDDKIGNVVQIRDAVVGALHGAGFDPNWIKTDEEREAADAEAEEMQQLQQGAQIAQGGAQVVNELANARLAVAQAEGVA